MNWTPQSSGVEIPNDVAEALDRLLAVRSESSRATGDLYPSDDGTDRPRRNPSWERDELILALDLYFRHRPPTRIGQEHPDVVALSDLLNRLPIHANRPDGRRFRNPNGVFMKLCNFLRFDSEYRGQGLARGGRGEEAVWKEFSHDLNRVREVAQTIRSRQEEVIVRTPSPEIEEDTFPEGRILYRLHRARERNPRLARAAKARALSEHGRLACAACSFDFREKYGSAGEGYIECHHTLPLSELAWQRETRLEDVALLCSNCHRMVHRRRPWLGLDQLAGLVRSRSDVG